MSDPQSPRPDGSGELIAEGRRLLAVDRGSPWRAFRAEDLYVEDADGDAVCHVGGEGDPLAEADMRLIVWLENNAAALLDAAAASDRLAGEVERLTNERNRLKAALEPVPRIIKGLRDAGNDRADDAIRYKAEADGLRSRLAESERRAAELAAELRRFEPHRGYVEAFERASSGASVSYGRSALSVSPASPPSPESEG